MTADRTTATRRAEHSGLRVPAIISHWSHAVDHLLWECPTVRRFPDSAAPVVPDVDPFGTDLCGWCVRVWKARNPALVELHDFTVNGGIDL